MARFTGKRILITGGTSGIGLAGAHRITAEDGRPILTGTRPHRISETRRELPEATVLADDAANPQAGEELAAAVADGNGLDGLWLNAGYADVCQADEITAEFFDGMMRTNVRGPMLQLARLAEHLNDGASVVLTSSTGAYEGSAVAGVYAATKGALIAVARGWANSLAGRGIRVNTLIPGAISTGFRDFMHANASSATSSAASRSGAPAPPRKPPRSRCSCSPTSPPTSPRVNTPSTEA